MSSQISIHALLAESDGIHYDNYNLHCVISIHALLAESDLTIMLYDASSLIFLSTLSLRRATSRRALGFVDPDISIHALLAESDAGTAGAARSRRDFYPRSPCGERPAQLLPFVRKAGISIHALLAESDVKSRSIPVLTFLISIHALLAESDLFALLCNLLHHYFYPRSPCGERQRRHRKHLISQTISIHALLAESDTLI